MWTLLAQPGRLTNDFIAGRRVEWIAPLKLYVTIFALSLFLYSAFQTVALYDPRNTIRLDRSGQISEAVAALTAKKHVAQDLFINEVNARWRSYASFSQIVYPIFLKLFYFRRRAGEHLAFSLHYNAVIFLIVILAWPLYLLTGMALTSRSAILAFVVTGAMAAYLAAALRKVYRQSWLASVLKGLVLYLDYYLVYVFVLYGSLGIAVVVSARRF